MSDDEDCGEIVLKHTVANLDIYDSDETEETDDEFEDLDFETRTRKGSVDESTEENAEILSVLLSDIGDVEPICSKLIRLDLYNKKGIKFLKKNDDIDFDSNEYGYPLLPADGEEFLLPFFVRMKKLRKELKGTKIETNVPGLEFTF